MSADLNAVAAAIVREAIARETKIAANQLKPDEQLESYGVESVMSVAIIRRLEDAFGELPKTLLFEYQTVGDLAGYFSSEHAAVLARMDRSLQLPGREEGEKSGPTHHAPTLPKAEPAIAAPVISLRDEGEDDAVLRRVLPAATFADRSPERANDLDTAASVGRAASQATDSVRIEDIAIVGIAGRFPRSESLEALWDNLSAGRDCITEIPERLWNWQDFFHPEKGTPGKSYSKWGGFIEDADCFDPLFFNISHLEAETMDPQERVFLEIVHHTLEDAGYTRASLKNRCVGLYVGIMWGQYQLYGSHDAATGSSYATIANRASYYFDFRGPSIALDTMCSGSMTAIHLACESIRRGEADLAVAGGVNVASHPNKYITLSKMGFASSDGRCKSFSASGDGYVPADGAGAVLLKPLRTAIADGDRIHAVIKATVIGHGGKVNGYAMPNANMQCEMIASALRRADIGARTISYVEAHAPGTALGDPIEIRALTNAFKQHTQDLQFCPIGSVKANIGHLESTAAFASIAKVVLQMAHRAFVPSIHCDNVNPNISFEKTPFYLLQQGGPWRTPRVSRDGGVVTVPRRAAINSFGAGGSNAHMILEEYLPTSLEPARDVPDQFLIVLSARNKDRLHALAARYVDRLSRMVTGHADDMRPTVDALEAASGVSSALIGSDDFIEDLVLDDAAMAHLGHELLERTGIAATAAAVARCGTVGRLAYAVRFACAAGVALDDAVDERAYLRRLAFMTQLGREAMNWRLALVVTNVQDLIERLRDYLAGDPAENSVHVGHIQNTAVLAATGTHDAEHLVRLVRKAQLQRLAQLWCQGAEIPWHHLYAEGVPRKMAVPQYPFARERFWTSNPPFAKPEAVEATAPARALSGPLLNLSLDGEVTFAETRRAIGEPAVEDAGSAMARRLGLLCETASRFAEAGLVGAIRLSSGASSAERLYTTARRHSDGIGIDIAVRGEPRGEAIAQARLDPEFGNDASLLAVPEPRPTVSSDQPADQGVSAFYASLAARGLVVPPHRRDLTMVAIDAEGALASFVAQRDDAAGSMRSIVHLLLALVPDVAGDCPGIHVDAIIQRKLPPDRGVIRVRRSSNDALDVEVWLDGELQLFVQGLRLDREAEARPTVEGLIHRTVWQELPPSAVVQAAVRGAVLLVRNKDAGEISELRRAIKASVIYEIILGQHSEPRDKTSWELDVRDDRAFSACVGHLKDLAGVYFLGGIDTSEETEAAERRLERAKATGPMAFLRLVQALEANRFFDRADFFVRIVTNNTVELANEQQVRPWAAGLSGLAKAFGREHPRVRLDLIDVDLTEDPTDRRKALVAALAEPLMAEGAIPHDSALREGRRYIRTFVPAPLAQDGLPAFRQGGVYILIGGSGTVGKLLTAHLAGYGATVLWVTRHSHDAEVRETAARLDMGKRLRHCRADVADGAALKAIFDAAEQEHGGINGVFHMAMTLELRRVNEMSEADLSRVLCAKAEGCAALLTALRDRQLDFLALFSSAEAFTANVGRGAYAAAVAYEDAFGTYLRRKFAWPVYVLNWGFWEGLDPEIAARMAQKGIRTLTAADGIEALERVVASGTPQAMIIDVDSNVLSMMQPERRKGRYGRKEEEPASLATEEPPMIPSDAANTLAPLAPPLDQLNAEIAKAFSEVLRIPVDKFDYEEDLVSYGVDSLLIVSIQKTLENRLGRIPAALLIENYTINALSKTLLARHPEIVARLMGGRQASPAGTTPPREPGRERSMPSPDPSRLIEVIRKDTSTELPGYLGEYGDAFRKKSLNDLPPRAHSAREIENFSSDGFVHGLVSTAICRRLEFISAGSGDPILFLAPVALTAPIWIKQFTSTLTRRHRCIALHAPGYGLSATIAEPNNAVVAQSFVQALSMLGVEQPVHIVAGCLGCVAATHLARQYPDKVASLTLVGAFHDASDMQVDDPRVLSADELAAMSKAAVESVNGDFERVIARLSNEEDERREVVSAARNLLFGAQCANSLVALRYLSEMLKVSMLDWIDEVRAPLQCVYGELDTIVQPHHSREIHERLPGARLVEIPGAAHFPFLTHAHLFNPILQRFLESQGAVAEPRRHREKREPRLQGAGIQGAARV